MPLERDAVRDAECGNPLAYELPHNPMDILIRSMAEAFSLELSKSTPRMEIDAAEISLD
jgi:hypothetical protein